MPEALPLVDIAILAAVFVVIAMLFLVRALVQGILSPLTGIPFIGGAFRAVSDAMVHAINSAMGAAVHAAQVVVGASWHYLARSTDWLWREIRSHANLLVAVATPLGLLWSAYAGIRALVHRLTATNTHSTARLKAVTRELNHLERRERALRRELDKGIGEDVLPRIKSLDREIHKIRTQTIPAIRAQDAANTSEIGHIWDWVRGKASVIGVGTFATAVTAVLATLGLDWLACRGRDNVNGKSGCGLWNEIEQVLGLMAAGLVLADFETLVREAQGLEDDALTLIRDAFKIG